jgi:adenosylcobinamide-GDP ribazoletransferase
MGRQLALLACATQFLTRLPVPPLKGFETEWLTRSARYFPLVGQLVGAMAALVLLAASQVWSPWIAALLALGSGLLLTGALHEDGLADSADGLFGGRTPEARVAIMKDSRIGAFGVLALGVVLALKVAGLAALPPAAAAVALIGAHGFGRAAVTVAMRATPYALAGRPTRWTPSAVGVRSWEAVMAVGFSLWPLALMAPPAAIAAVLGGSVASAAGASLAQRRLGGHTGDVLGAVEQLGEMGFLLGACAVWP